MFTRALLDDEAWWRYCHHAFSERSWVYRQIDTITISDDETTLLSTSIDISNGALRAMQNSPVFNEVRQVPLLLSVKVRGRVISMGVKLNGKSQIIWNAADSANFAFSALLHCVNRELKRLSDGSKHLADYHDAVKLLKEEFHPYMREGNHLAYLNNVVNQFKLRLSEGITQESRVERYFYLISKLIIRNEEAMQFLRRIRYNLPLVAWIDPLEGFENQKLELTIKAPRRDEAGMSISSTDSGLQQRLEPQFLLDRDVIFRISLSQLLAGGEGNPHYHWKFEAPDDMLIGNVQVGYDKSEDKKAIDYSEAGFFATSSHLEVFGSILTNSKIKSADSALFITLILRNRVFLYKAITACASLAMLLSFLMVFLVRKNFSNTPVLLSLIGLLPSTSLLFYQRDDNEIVNTYLRKSRRLMASSISIVVFLVSCSFLLRLGADSYAYCFNSAVLNPFILPPLLLSVLLLLVTMFFAFKFYFLSRKRRRTMDKFLRRMKESWGFA